MKVRIILLQLLLSFIVLLAINYNQWIPQTPTQIPQQNTNNLKIDDPYYDHYMNSKKLISFDQWCKLNNKVYENQKERSYRMQIYMQNLIKIRQHNMQYQLGKSTFFKGTTPFTDLTGQQFTHKYSWKSDPTLKITTSCNGSIMDAPNPPAQLNWGNKVGAVVNQGQCGKDWAIVAVSAVESLYSLKLSTLPVLSVQQLLQCSVDYGNQGCFGGFMDQAFQYIIDHGIATNKTYPDKIYPNQTVDKCRYISTMRYTGISKCARVPSRSYSKLLSAVVQQPVSVAVDQNYGMQNYRGGIYTGMCTSTLNHAMLLVGYGGVQAQDYHWILRNSLGDKWGIDGFIHLKRVQSDGDGQCGIQIWPTVPQNII